MPRERRSLWGSISQSNKVNKVSIKAALLYTWAIPHFDDEGYQAGEPKHLKVNIVPFRDDIPLTDIKNLEIELIIAGLWDVFHINSTVYIHDPVWNERQSFKGLHKYPSKIKELIGDTPKTIFHNTQQGVVVHPDRCIREVKIREDKRKEVKGSTPQNFISSLSQNLTSPSKTLDPISRKAELKRQAQELLKGD